MASSAVREEQNGFAYNNIPAHLEIDDPEGDNDSALGEDSYTITTSITSSVTAYHHHNGRRYHAFDSEAYALPNDEMEAARLDLQHHVWKITLDGAFGRVPITPQIRTVLDVGTGTGIWAIELADAYPNISVTGTDLSPIQPEWVPPNCRFLVDNAEAEWAFEHRFDYIHARMLTVGIRDWAKFFRQAWDALEPGGWIETCETQPPGRRVEGPEEPGKESPFMRWGMGIRDASKNAGVDTMATERFSEMLAAQGFVNIDRVDVQWPLTPWAKGRKNKIMGRLMFENLKNVIPAAANLMFTRYLDWTDEEVKEFAPRAIADLEQGHYYYLMPLHRAQKPLTAT